jgi:hypothetical protein
LISLAFSAKKDQKYRELNTLAREAHGGIPYSLQPTGTLFDDLARE